MLVEIGFMVLQALWFIAPAYAANAFPPLLRGKIPLDKGNRLNRHRVLGEGKTLEGTFGGIFFGVFFGSVQIYFQPLLPAELGLYQMTFPLIFLLSFGAIAGDIVNSFFKRRFGIKRGERIPFINRLDFLASALLFAYIVARIRPEHIIILFLVTPVVHKVANLIGFALKIKKVPY